MADLRARAIAFNATGPVQTLTATNLDATASFTVRNVAGQISGSSLNLLGNDVQFANLRRFLFQDCVFTLPQRKGVVNGVHCRTSPGKKFTARFQGCRFTTAAGAHKGNLIFSEATLDPANRVAAEFENCRYDPAFAKEVTIFVANLGLHGEYTFLKADLGGLDVKKAFSLSKPGTVDVQGATVRIEIP